MRIYRTGLWSIVALVLGASPAHASLIYSFSFDQPTYAVAFGQQVAVQVSLNETGSSGDAFVLAPGGDGMFGTGVRLNYSGSAPAKVLSDGDIAGNPDFDNAGFGISTVVDPSVATAGFTQSIFLNSPVHGTLIAPNEYQLLLGTFTFTAGSVPGSFLITATRFDSGDNLITGMGQVLDNLVLDASAGITVGSPTTIPEPNSLIMCLIACLTGLGVHCLRRHVT